MRVVVTGMGSVTALGGSVAEFREALFAGRSGIGPVTVPDGGSLHFRTVAAVKEFDPQRLLSSAQMLTTERSSRFALVAAKEAVAASGVMDEYRGDEVGIVLGCSVGGREADEPEVVKLYTNKGRVHPLTIPRVMGSAGTSQVSMAFGVTGPSMTISTACASGTHAIGQAFAMVRSGMVGAAICGGHEAGLTYGFLKAWEAMRVVSAEGCRPFAADRDGMTLGEGAAVLVLEEAGRAKQRGATILGEIVGFGMSADAGHVTQPQVSGPVSAMRAALRDGAVEAGAIGYLNAHGTGTAANDAMEAEAIRIVFGSDAAKLPVSSTKGLHGHAIGAAGAIEAMAALLALRGGLLPANAGTRVAEPGLGFDLLRESREARPEFAMSNSFAFGGLNGVLVFRRGEG